MSQRINTISTILKFLKNDSDDDPFVNFFSQDARKEEQERLERLRMRNFVDLSNDDVKKPSKTVLSPNRGIPYFIEKFIRPFSDKISSYRGV